MSQHWIAATPEQEQAWHNGYMSHHAARETEHGLEVRVITDAEQALIAAVEAHALAHYEDGGWDVIVECWDKWDILAAIDRHDATTTEQAIAALDTPVSVYSDRQADARNSAF